jgi:1,4-alpha-glucan branching enzyme
MKKIIWYFFIFSSFVINAQVSISPSTFEVNQSITITVDLNSTETDCNGLNNPSKVYMHSGIGDNSDAFGFSVVGNWGQDDGVGEMSNNGDGTWSITITPETYYGLTTSQAENATQIGIVFRNADGSEELKANGCNDFFIPVGVVNINIIEPWGDSIIVLSGNNLTIKTNLSFQGSLTPGSFEIYYNDVLQDSGNGFTTFLGSIDNITSDGTVKIVGSPLSSPSEVDEKTFEVVIQSSATQQTIPSGLVEGINYDDTDDSKATLVINAPGKDYIEVAASWNNYTPTSTDAMKKDTTSDLFWLEITGLTSGKIETYQYWVYDASPVINSPYIVKTADPYSTLVLSPFDDPSIPASSYPSLPAYPTGQEREVTVLQTGKTTYNWQVTNFTKPKKEDLVIYEVLIRDFDADRNFQDIIDKISYFKNLNINAIQLMPIMEFEGNESWGYNTAFHMALDKFYGTEEKFKELVDVCHQNGIAVILDVALNHAFGRNPMVRMWMDDSDNDGWGEPSSENPYFNQTPKHSYNVGSDFDHSNSLTKLYTKRVVKHWIEEFKIDGFRWDLTKGFTQNCSSNDEGCTNSYQADRVAILKDYADYSWSLDETHYVIFEHLGSDNEEKEWANYRLNDPVSKGIMMWGKMTDPYGQLTMGYSSDSDISRMGHKAHTGFTGKRLLGYAESHDEVRIMEKNWRFGNSSGGYDTKDINTALSRIGALGAVSLTIPGPKMIWHFGELGMENSIFTCNNGSLNLPDDAPPSGDNGSPSGDCKLDTKPQPQWTNDWLNDTNRSPIYDAWSRINDLKINEPVFEGDYNITSGNLTPRISIFTGDENTSGSELKNVVIIANFELTSTNINPSFPYTGTWYDLMDTSNSPATISGSATAVNLAPGEFRIYGNQASTLSNKNFENQLDIQVYPNPVSEAFQINKAVESISIFDLSGKVIKRFKGKYEKGFSFNISDLSQSFYILKIETDTGKKWTSKLVKL